jgi:hypothetical protein
MARFAVPDGWTVQAFQFALDCSPEQEACLRRQFGGRRYARDWAVRTLREDITRHRETGQETEAPSLAGLRKRWNQAKTPSAQTLTRARCGGRRSARRRSPTASRPRSMPTGTGTHPGPGHAGAGGRGSRGSRRRAATGTGSPSPPARSASRPTAGTSPSPGSARCGAMRTPGGCSGSLARAGRGLSRPRSRGEGLAWWWPSGCSSSGPSSPASPCPAHGSEWNHGEIVIEGLDTAGMLRQKGLTGARARRRGLSDSALGQTRRQLAYKTGWYGSRLVIADRWYPSSKTCHACGNVQDIGWSEHWTCTGCGTSHQRDDNAAINLARYEPPASGDSALGPVRAAVKRRADRKTRPRRAGGDETRKGPSPRAEKQPRDGVPISDSL